MPERRTPAPQASEALPDGAFVKGGRSEKGISYSWNFFEAHPDKIVPGALNNFAGFFPGGQKRLFMESTIRAMPEFVEEEKYKERMKLFALVEQIAGDVGVDLEQIKKQLEERYRLSEEGKYEDGDALLGQIREQIIPVYKRLRELGYTHKELVT